VALCEKFFNRDEPMLHEDHERIEHLAKVAVDCGYRLHRDIGPGLLESVYEILLCEYLREAGLAFQRQVPVPIRFKALSLTMRFGPTSSSKGSCFWNSNQRSNMLLFMQSRC
jgi:hypothetical protein